MSKAPSQIVFPDGVHSLLDYIHQMNHLISKHQAWMEIRIQDQSLDQNLENSLKIVIAKGKEITNIAKDFHRKLKNPQDYPQSELNKMVQIYQMLSNQKIENYFLTKIPFTSFIHWQYRTDPTDPKNPKDLKDFKDQEWITFPIDISIRIEQHLAYGSHPRLWNEEKIKVNKKKRKIQHKLFANGVGVQEDYEMGFVYVFDISKMTCTRINKTPIRKISPSPSTSKLIAIPKSKFQEIRRIQILSTLDMKKFPRVPEDTKNQVIKHFQVSCNPKNFHVLNVYSVENKNIAATWAGLQYNFLKRLGKQFTTEKWMWYCPFSLAILNQIQAEGFNRDNPKLITTGKLGKGVYFTNNALGAILLADSYYKSVSEEKEEKKEAFQTILYCQILPGQSCLGDKTFDKAKTKKEDQNDTYDSFVDNLQNPSILVTQKDGQGLPAYLVEFLTY
jgi:hypothetical protein